MKWNTFHQAVENINKLMHSCGMNRSAMALVFGIEICTTVCVNPKWKSKQELILVACDYTYLHVTSIYPELSLFMHQNIPFHKQCNHFSVILLGCTV